MHYSLLQYEFVFQTINLEIPILFNFNTIYNNLNSDTLHSFMNNILHLTIKIFVSFSKSLNNKYKEKFL